MSAIVDLYQEQVQEGANSHAHPRDRSVKELLHTLCRERHQVQRSNYADRGIGTLQDGYTSKEELAQMCKYYMKEGTGKDLRNMLAQLLSNHMALRGESARSLEFADMFSVNLPNEGNGNCVAFIAILSQGKTNQVGRIEFGACMRNRDVRICGIGALALYMFQRYHMEGENIPNFANPEEWYKIKLLRTNAGTPMKSMTYKTQYNAVVKCLNACGMISKAKTHCGRGSSVRMAELLGVPEFDLRQLGRWNTSAMEKCYLTQLPRRAMRALAGFDMEESNYFLRREVHIPEDLKAKVFPWVDEWILRRESVELSKRDLASLGFLKLMKYLRKVFLEDSVALQQIYPHHPIWRHQILQSEVYKRFQNSSQRTMEAAIEPHEMTLRQAVPGISQMINERHAEIMQQLANFHEEDNNRNEEIRRTMNALYNIQVKQASSTMELHQLRMSQIVPTSIPNVVEIADMECTEGLQQRMSRSITTVKDLYQEWEHGIGGNLPIKELERRYGTKWRSSFAESKFFNRRKKIVSSIEKYGNIHQCSIEDSIKHFTRLQGTNSLSWLAQYLYANPTEIN